MPLLRSFGYAFAGFGHLLRTQRNFRIELAIGLGALAAAAWWRIEPWEWAVLVLTVSLVLILEAVNTAIENAVTLASPSLDPRAKAAKDVSAAAVLIASFAALALGIVIFGPRLTAVP
ncbi:MAG TPA: diacylglycerol kinase family protein [Methylomirabilota bacterium]|nr:diacylglycerol kinase family protein [Methylomirabilota bacterium]